jgi:hypothetical protein
MRSLKTVEYLITEQWPDLKKRAERETDHERLTAILGEIDDLLFILERRIADRETMMGLDSTDESRSGRNKSGREVDRGVPEIGSQ